MSQCPLCAAKITEDFGLIECPNCSAQLIVHMDGRVEYSGGKEMLEPLPEEEAAPDAFEHSKEKEEDFLFGDAPQEFEPLVTQVQAQAIFEEPAADIGEQAGDEGLFGDNEPTEAYQPEPEPEPAPAPTPKAVRPPPPPPPRPQEPIVVPEGSADLSDIARFGNSDASSLRDGTLRYNLLISGIDTADVREAFREAITDRKLVWDTDAILRSLKNGEVRIQGVTPPKAYILISRLRNLPIHVFWEQYGIAHN